MSRETVIFVDESWIDVHAAEFTPPDKSCTLNCYPTANAIEIELLLAQQSRGRTYRVRYAAGTHQVTFDALSGVVIGDTGESVTVAFDGAAWVVVGQHP